MSEFEKIKRSINSCENILQLDTCVRMIRRFKKSIGSETLRDEMSEILMSYAKRKRDSLGSTE